MKYTLQLAGGKVKLFSMVSSHENEAFNVSIVVKIYIYNVVDGMGMKCKYLLSDGIFEIFSVDN